MAIRIVNTFVQDAYAKYIRQYYSSDVQTYDQKYLKKTTFTGDNSMRLWWFQVCTEVAYFQVAPKNDSIRSPKLDTRHFLNTTFLFTPLSFWLNPFQFACLLIYIVLVLLLGLFTINII